MADSIALIEKYFPQLTDLQKQQFKQLGTLYPEWNEKINVISRKDIDHLYERHILHSLGIAKVMDFAPGTTVLDVGTGGGFPGMPLAILFPETSFLLVDSIGKKIKVVQEIAGAIGLKNLKAEHIRAEKVKGTFTYVTSRAVTRMKPFLNWVQNKMDQSPEHLEDRGILVLKGGDLEEEMAEIRFPYQETPLSDYFEEPFFETKKVIYIPL